MPVSDVDRAKGFYRDWGGGSTPTPAAPSITYPYERRAVGLSTELYLRETASRAGSVQFVRATSSRHAATPLKPSAKKEMRRSIS